MIHPLEQSWQARYFDGRRPIRHDVMLRLGDRGIAVTEQSGEETLWLYTELRQVSGQYEGEQFCFERNGSDPPESIVIDDERFVAALHQHAPAEQRDWGRNMQSIGWPRVILAGLGVVALASGFYFWGTQMLAEVTAEVVPVSVEEKLGEAVANSFAPETSRCDSEELQSAIDQMVARLEAAAPANPYRFRVAIARDDMVNAFAAPGGQIIVFNGLVKRTETPEELAGVLAHEMQHVIQQHSTRAIISAMGGRAVLAVLTGDTGSSSMMVEGAATLVNLHYAREAEEAADSAAAETLRRADIDPIALADFFQIIQKEEGDLPDTIQYLSTHPDTDARIARLGELAASEEPVEAQPILPGVDWKVLRRACSSPPG